MNDTERRIRRNILIAEEIRDSWSPWHCHKYFCDHHMCKVRHAKLDNLECKLHKLYALLRAIQVNKRRINGLYV